MISACTESQVRSALSDYTLEPLWSAEMFGVSRDLGANRPFCYESRRPFIATPAKGRLVQAPKSKESLETLVTELC
jgi:hypothetical protein